MTIQYFTSIQQVEIAIAQLQQHYDHVTSGPAEDWLEPEELAVMNPRPVAAVLCFTERDMACGLDEYFI